MSDNTGTRTCNWWLVERLNALFRLRSRETVHRGTYVTPLQFLGGATVQSVEGTLHAGWPKDVERIVVIIAVIEEIVHLIPLETEKRWLVDNRIDLESWNII